MRLTKMSRCGVRAIFDIAYHSLGLPVPAKDISNRQEIPLKFLEQILNKMGKANVVKGLKGPSGGYILARAPNKISVKDIIKAVREPTDLVNCANCTKAPQCVTRLVWKEAAEIINKFFDSVTISDLCEKGKDIGIRKEVTHSFDYSV